MVLSVTSDLNLDSCIKVHHVYKTTWTPYVGEIIQDEKEPENAAGMYDFCVKKEGEIVVHLKKRISRR